MIEELNLNVWTTQDIKLKGIETVMTELQRRLKVQGIKNIHMSFDIDCLDKSLVPGTGTPVAKGLNLFETKYILKDLMQTGFIKSLDFVELNALLDRNDSTAGIAIDLIHCIFKNLK